jgi:hypothetical protein
MIQLFTENQLSPSNIKILNVKSAEQYPSKADDLMNGHPFSRSTSRTKIY